MCVCVLFVAFGLSKTEEEIAASNFNAREQVCECIHVLCLCVHMCIWQFTQRGKHKEDGFLLGVTQECFCVYPEAVVCICSSPL